MPYEWGLIVASSLAEHWRMTDFAIPVVWPEQRITIPRDGFGGTFRDLTGISHITGIGHAVSALGFQIADDFDQMGQGAPEAIQSPDGEHVTRLQTRKQLVEFRALGRRARHLVSDNFFASRSLEGIALRVGILIDG